MDASIEMKIQEIDKLLELRKQIIEIQTPLNMDIGVYGFETVLIENNEDFLELADYVGKGIEKGIVARSGNVEFLLKYKGIKFNIFVRPDNAGPFMERMKK